MDMSGIDEALKGATDTRSLRIGKGLLKHVPELFAEQFPGKNAIVVADLNTYRVAGEKVYEELKTAGFTRENPFIFTEPDLYAGYCYVERLVSILERSDAIPIAVGSGTINDLAKLSSHLTRRSYLCVATAASMDG